MLPGRGRGILDDLGEDPFGRSRAMGFVRMDVCVWMCVCVCMSVCLCVCVYVRMCDFLQKRGW